jgi:hypothetical protein
MTRSNNENRTGLYTSRIPPSSTGLSGAIYVHLEIADYGRATAIKFSHKQKDGSSLDRILTALGNCATQLLRAANEEKR